MAQNYEHVYFFSGGTVVNLLGEDINGVKNTTEALLLASKVVGLEVNV
jgi:hypothetical protein